MAPLVATIPTTFPNTSVSAQTGSPGQTVKVPVSPSQLIVDKIHSSHSVVSFMLVWETILVLLFPPFNQITLLILLLLKLGFVSTSQAFRQSTYSW